MMISLIYLIIYVLAFNLALSYPLSKLRDDLNLLNIPINCNISQSDLPEIQLNNTNDFLSMANLRARYPRNQLVVITLNAQNTYDGSGNLLTSAFNVTSPVAPYNSSMSCSYIRGWGMDSTQVVVYNVDYALRFTDVHDVIFADLAIDRANSSFNDILEYCQGQTFGVNVSSPSQPPPDCTYFNQYAGSSGSGGNIIGTSGAISIYGYNNNAVSFLRVKTIGGISISRGSNHLIHSCFVSSKSQAAINTYANTNLTIINNTITAFYGDGVYTNGQQYGNILNNYLYETGWACLTSRRSNYQNFMFNFCRNFTYLKTSITGGAGYYSWNAFGWSSWGRVVKYNWFWSPSSKCYYFDSMDSNTVFDSNVCANSVAELNGGRFNALTNNLWLYLAKGVPGYARLADVNCVGTMSQDPLSYTSCANNQGIMSPIWDNRYPNGTMKTPFDYNGTIVQTAPQLKWDSWCAPLTAGPNNTVCSIPSNTFYFNGTRYPMPCEALPSNNIFEFVVVYNTSYPLRDPGAGFACICPGPACPTPNPSFPNFTFDSRSLIPSLNTLNISYYSFFNKSTVDLFGYSYQFDAPDFSPKQFVISPDSVIGKKYPRIASIPYSQIGLLPSNSGMSPTTLPNGNGNLNTAQLPVVLIASLCASFVALSAIAVGLYAFRRRKRQQHIAQNEINMKTAAESTEALS